MSLRKIRIVPSASGAAGVDDFSSADSAMAATPNKTAKTLSLQSIFCSNSVHPKTFVENKLLVFCIYFVFFFFIIIIKERDFLHFVRRAVYFFPIKFDRTRFFSGSRADNIVQRL